MFIGRVGTPCPMKEFEERMEDEVSPAIAADPEPPFTLLS